MPGKGVAKAAGAPRTPHAAVNMRIAGAPYEEIARVLEYATPAQARVAVEEQLAGLFPVEDRQALFQIVSARHEALFRSVYTKATKEYLPARDEYGDVIPGEQVPNKEQAIYNKLALDILGRMSRLHGLDAPTQVQISPDAEQFEGVVAGLVQKALAGQEQEADIFADDIEDAVVVGDEDEPV